MGWPDHHLPGPLPGVQHVLRSDPRGVRGIDDQLRRRSVGAPAARSLLLTILGEYVLPRGEAVWQETLVGALVSVGHTEQAARQALARSVRGGWLSTSRHGRRSRVALSPRSAELLASGASRIYSFGSAWSWDGRWLVLVLRVPEARREVRHQLRTRLAWAGLGSMGGGVWLTPHVSREAELHAAVSEAELRAAVSDAPAALATSFVASMGMLGRAEDVAAAAWDLEAVRSQYEAFIADFAAIRPSSGEASFRMQTLLVHAWRKFPFLDPDLPAELLPPGWPRRRAHELFKRRHSAWGDAAREYFEELEAGRPARRAKAA
jgi:phenylacetic acid degradation operon negative regulatory protein